MEVKQRWVRSVAAVPVKKCPRCGTLFSKRTKDSAKQWAEREYCSIVCINKGRLYSTIAQRILNHVQPIPLTGCWIWMGAVTRSGYGVISTKFKQPPMKAHRASYEVFKGDIPEGMLIRHKCDNPYCVNPAHLELGTQVENMRDMVERKRMNPKSLLNLRQNKSAGR